MNSGNSQTTNINTGTSTSKNSPTNNNAPNNNISSGSSNNNISSVKKNESHLANMKKTNLATSKMITNELVQNKNPPMQKSATIQPTTTRNPQPRSKQSQNEQSRESQNLKDTNKVPQAPQQLPKSVSNHQLKQPSSVQRTTGQSRQTSEQQQATLEKRPTELQPSGSQDEGAVTFAHHLKVHDDDVRLYTFGFFEEQPNQTQQPKTTTIANQTILVDKNDSMKQSSLSQQSVNNQPKINLKQPKASPNSEKKCFKSNDKIDATSFNYDQILKFISSRKYLATRIPMFNCLMSQSLT